MRLPLLSSCLVALAALASCVTTPTTLRGLAQDQRDDVLTPPKNSEEALALAERLQERADKARKLLGEKDASSAAAHYYAALVFVQCHVEADLELAQQQALAAAELGEQRGFRVAAEAEDKLLLKRGMLQRYGTQFVWEPVLRAWRLYPIDPRTTDAERKAMGVPALEQIKQQEAELNQGRKSASKGD